MITGSAALAGVVGWPVRHSRSPLLHNYWLGKHGIDGAYVPLPVASEELGAALKGLRAAGFRGVNVTVPHKEAALALCDTADESSWRIGAVNTLVFDETGIHGRNTDGAGFIANLAAHGVTSPPSPALVLGAGGAARSVIAALQAAGVEVTVTNRSPERAAALAAFIPGLHILPWSERSAALGTYRLLVNTTAPGGLAGEALEIDLSQADSALVVADIVYVPVETTLLALARACGLKTVSGVGMLLHQAAPGFAAWFGVMPSVDDDVIRLVTQDIEPHARTP